MKIGCIKKSDALYPVTPNDIEEFAKIPNGLHTIIDVTAKRNVLLFRKFWSLCRLILDNDPSGNFRDVHHVKDSLMIMAGYYDQCWLFDGTFYLRPQSVSFESCSDEKFQDIWKKILPHVMNFLGCSEAEINENIVFYM